MYEKCYTIKNVLDCPNEDGVGYREGFFRVREYGKYGKLLRANSKSMTSKRETKEEFLDRVRKSERYRDWKYIK